MKKLFNTLLTLSPLLRPHSNVLSTFDIFTSCLGAGREPGMTCSSDRQKCGDHLEIVGIVEDQQPAFAVLEPAHDGG